MSFIRPEAAANISRWRELLIGLGVLAIGAWWALSFNTFLNWIGIVLCIAGVALSVTGLQRGRFRTGNSGPGVVQVDEGRIVYFGPLTGGSADLAEVTELALDPTAIPAHWRLSQPGQPQLFIPVNAAGNEALFDAFSSLPGMRSEMLITAMRGDGSAPKSLWRRGQRRGITS